MIQKIYFLLYRENAGQPAGGLADPNRFFISKSCLLGDINHLVLTEFVAATIMILVIYIMLRTHRLFMENKDAKSQCQALYNPLSCGSLPCAAGLFPEADVHGLRVIAIFMLRTHFTDQSLVLETGSPMPSASP